MRQNNSKFNKAMHKLVGVLNKYGGGGWGGGGWLRMSLV